MRDAALAKEPSTALSFGVAFLGILLAIVMAIVVAAGPASGYNSWAGMVAPVIFLSSLPILARQATREGNRRVFWFLAGALLLRLAAALLAHFIAFEVYAGEVDASGYHNRAIPLSERFRDGHFETGLPTVTGWRFPILLNGIIYAFIGPSRLGGFFVHAWLGFWGLFLLYRAFVEAVPEGRSRTYARLLFLLPSELFWTSTMGKDPWMVFGLGIAALGTARILTGRYASGGALVATGSWMMWLVRPHIAGIFGLALVAGALARRHSLDSRNFGVAGKAVVLAGLLVAAFFLLRQTDEFLEESGIDVDKGVAVALEEAGEQGGFGGSAFDPVVVDSPIDLPIAGFTVLFRPLPIEANNFLAMLAALEGSLLALLSVIRWRWVVGVMKNLRRQPYLAFALSYVVLFVIGFSGIANFGLLVRQRTQVLPLFVVLLAFPPRKVVEDFPSRQLPPRKMVEARR